MSIKVSKKFQEILARDGRSIRDVTHADVQHYRKSAVISPAEEIRKHNEAIAAKKAARKKQRQEEIDIMVSRIIESQGEE